MCSDYMRDITNHTSQGRCFAPRRYFLVPGLHKALPASIIAASVESERKKAVRRNTESDTPRSQIGGLQPSNGELNELVADKDAEDQASEIEDPTVRMRTACSPNSLKYSSAQTLVCPHASLGPRGILLKCRGSRVPSGWCQISRNGSIDHIHCERSARFSSR